MDETRRTFLKTSAFAAIAAAFGLTPDAKASALDRSEQLKAIIKSVPNERTVHAISGLTISGICQACATLDAQGLESTTFIINPVQVERLKCLWAVTACGEIGHPSLPAPDGQSMLALDIEPIRFGEGYNDLGQTVPAQHFPRREVCVVSDSSMPEHIMLILAHDGTAAKIFCGEKYESA